MLFVNIKGIIIFIINFIMNNVFLKYWYYIFYVLGKEKKVCKLFVEVVYDKKGYVK